MLASRQWLRKAPTWALCFIFGTYFAAVMTVFGYIEQDGSFTSFLVPGLLSGALFGAFMGPISVRQRKAEDEAAGELPEGKEAAVYRAVGRGPVPEDDEVRRAAAGIAQQRLRQAERWGRWTPLMWLAFVALAAYLTVTSSPWWLLLGALFAGFLAWQLLTPRHLRQRLAVLRQPLHGETTGRERPRDTTASEG